MKRSISSTGSLVTQSGPGIPQWHGREVTLMWDGAVPKGHTVSMLLLPFWAGIVMCIVRGCLLAYLLFLVLRSAPTVLMFLKREGQGQRLAALMPTIVAVSAMGVQMWQLDDARAQEAFPPTVLLGELEERLRFEKQAANPCAVNCISTESLRLTIKDEKLEGAAIVHSVGNSTWFLPSIPLRSAVSSITINGAPTSAAFRSQEGTVVVIEDGVHLVKFTIPIDPSAPVTLRFSESPGKLSTAAEGYRAFTERTSAGVTVQFLPEQTAPEVHRGQGIDVTPWYKVTRRVEVGFDIRTQMTVERIGDISTEGAVEIALLPGERIINAGVKRKEGSIVVTTKAGDTDLIEYSGIVPNPENTIGFKTLEGGSYSEEWYVTCAAQWSCSFEGLQPIEKFSNARATYLLKPRPGDETLLKLSKLKGAPGENKTLLLAHNSYEPSSHFLRNTLSLSVRAGQASSQQITLPEGALIKEVRINGKDVLDATNTAARPLEIPILKGTHAYSVVWQEPQELTVWPKFESVNLHTAYTNGSSSFTVPKGWTPVYAKAGQLGPYIGLLPFIVIECLLVCFLTLVLPIPIRLWQSIFLVIGASILGAPAAHLVCVWLGLSGLIYHLRRSASSSVTIALSSRLATACQYLALILPILVLAAFLISSLNGTPDVQIRGQLSTQAVLFWYLDRGIDQLIVPALLMVPNLLWQILLLGWGLLAALISLHLCRKVMQLELGSSDTQ